MKMFLYFSVSLEYSDLSTSQDCARLEGMKTKWIEIKLKLTSQASSLPTWWNNKGGGGEPKVNQEKK